MIFKAMYNRAGTYVSNTRVVRSLLDKSSARFGCRMDDPASARHVAAFIRSFNTDMSDFARGADEYRSFNDFFMRRLAPGARPIAARDDPRVMVAPADCRLLVYPSVSECQRLWVKSKQFSVADLLTDKCPAGVREQLAECSVVLSRLAPQDYHHWHMPVDAKFVSSYDVAGALFSVTPAAVQSSLNVLGENKRTVYVFDSATFGAFVLVSVGACMVGCIECVCEPGQALRKGDEHGYFKFGGSTVIGLFQKGKIQFDAELLANSSRPIETLVKMGERIGTYSEPLKSKPDGEMCSTGFQKESELSYKKLGLSDLSDLAVDSDTEVCEQEPDQAGAVSFRRDSSFLWDPLMRRMGAMLCLVGLMLALDQWPDIGASVV